MRRSPVNAYHAIAAHARPPLAWAFTKETPPMLCKSRLFTAILGVCMLYSAAAQAATSATPASPAQAPAPAASAPITPASLDTAKITKLKNGLSVYVLKDDRFPLVSTRLYVRAGSAYEDPKVAGISHLLEHMVFKGTDKRPKGTVARDVEAVGGYLNAATSFDYTVYLTDLPSAHWQLGMDVVKDMAFHPTLDAAELESEKDVVVSELQRGKDSPDMLVFESLQERSLKGTPYARPIIGFADTIKAVTPADMRAYIAKYYQPQNMLLVVVGNIDAAAVLAEAEKLFGGLANTADITPIQPLDAQALSHGATVHVEPGPWNKVYLGMALPVPGDQDVRSIPLDVLAHLLGGDATSYFYQKYKYEKNLVDSISVGNFSFERVGMLYITAQLDADKVQPFWQEFVADLATLKAERFTAQEIARTQLQIEDSLHRVKETLSGLASWKGRLQLFFGGEQGGENILTELRNVNTAQMQQAIDTWLKPERLSVAVLTPKDVTLPDLNASLHAAWPASAKPAAAQAAALTGKVETVDLGHGRSVVLIPDTTMPYTALDLYMPGGDSLLPPAQQGLASLTARVLTSGTSTRSAPEMERYLADRAAALSAVAGRQTFGLSMREPSRFNPELFTLFREVLTDPAFADKEVQREKADQIASIRSRDDKALGMAFAEMPPFLFPGGHSYGYRTLGTIKDVEAYTPAQVRAFWDRQIRQPWVLSVAGDFDREAVLAFARTLPVPKDKGVKLDAPLWGKQKDLKLTLPGRNQAHLMLVFKTVPNSHADSAGLELLENVLAGQSGLLFRELRDKQGLGYTVTAVNRPSPEAGYMIFYIGTEPGKMDQARAGFEKVIADLQAQPVAESEVQSAKNQMLGSYYRSRQRLSSRSAEAASLNVLGLDLNFRKDRIDEAGTKTPADLQALAKKYLNTKDAYLVTVTP